MQLFRQQKNTVYKQNGHLRTRLVETTSKAEKEKPHKLIPALSQSENEKRKEVTEMMFHQAESLNTMMNKQDIVTIVDLEERSDCKMSRNNRELKEHKLQQEQERARRQRLQKSLENLRPTSSSGGRYNASTNTPVIFDLVSQFSCHYSSIRICFSHSFAL